jgi:hypothetical protein
MKPIDDGGPAFPVPQDQPMPGHSDGGWASNFVGHPGQGMTLRDYFAAKALPAIIADCTAGDGFSTTEEFGTDHGPENQYQTVAQDAYAIADAMLAARNRGVS